MVHSVLGCEEDAHPRPERSGEAKAERERAAVQRAAAELRTDHRKLAQRRVDDPPLELTMPLQNEAEHGRQDEQEREDRKEAVVGDCRRQVAALIVGVLLQHGEREAEPTMTLLETIEAPVSLAEPTHLPPRAVAAT